MKNNRLSNKFFISFFLILFFCSSFVKGVDAPISSDPNMVCSDLKNTFFSEEIKTRSDLKNYIDFKSDALITSVTEKSQKFLDENFIALDNRIHQYMNIFLIKLVIGIIASVLLAHMIYFLIINTINKLRRERGKIELETRKREF